MTLRKFKYDLALSFADTSPDSAVAEALNNALKKEQISTYYFKEKSAVGKNIFEKTLSIYGKKARFVLLIASKNYAANYWSRLEFSVVKPRINENKVIPVRLDHTVLDGLSGDIEFLTWNSSNPDCATELAPIIAEIVKNEKKRQRALFLWLRGFLLIFSSTLAFILVPERPPNPGPVSSLTVTLVDSATNTRLDDLSDLSLHLNAKSLPNQLNGKRQGNVFFWQFDSGIKPDTLSFNLSSSSFRLSLPKNEYLYQDSIALTVSKKRPNSPKSSLSVPLKGIVRDSVNQRPLANIWVQTEFGDRVKTGEDGSFQFAFEEKLKYRQVRLTFFPQDSGEKPVVIDYTIPKLNCLILL